MRSMEASLQYRDELIVMIIEIFLFLEFENLYILQTKRLLTEQLLILVSSSPMIHSNFLKIFQSTLMSIDNTSFAMFAADVSNNDCSILKYQLMNYVKSFCNFLEYTYLWFYYESKQCCCVTNYN